MPGRLHTIHHDAQGMNLNTISKNSEQEFEIRDHLKKQYAGIFDETSIIAHIRDYVGFVFSDSVAPLVARQVKPGSRVLDIGCGFGAFVISARRLGLDAVGVEIAPFEIEYARQRLQKEFPRLDPSSVYHLGDGHKVPFDDHSFEVVTLWNVLEHVPDGKRLLKEVERILRPNGLVFIICPNYAAFRQEAHYIVPWWPLLPRKLASVYLRMLGRNPRFFETSIFYRTNWEIQCALKNLGMQVFRIEGPAHYDFIAADLFLDLLKQKIMHPEMLRNVSLRRIVNLFNRLHLKWVLILGVTIIAFPHYFRILQKRVAYYFHLYNPVVESVVLSARKIAK